MCVKNKMTSNGPMRVPPAHMGYSSNIGPILVPFGHFSQILPIWHPLLAGFILSLKPGRVAQSVGHPTHKSGVLGSIPGLATYFRFSFRFFKKGSCQLLAKVCARSTG